MGVGLSVIVVDIGGRWLKNGTLIRNLPSRWESNTKKLRLIPVFDCKDPKNISYMFRQYMQFITCDCYGPQQEPEFGAIWSILGSISHPRGWPSPLIPTDLLCPSCTYFCPHILCFYLSKVPLPRRRKRRPSPNGTTPSRASGTPPGTQGCCPDRRGRRLCSPGPVQCVE